MASFQPPTPEQVATWKAEKIATERVVADAQRKLAALTKMLEAADLWNVPAAGAVQGDTTETVGDTDPGSFMGAVEKMANESPSPLKRAKVRTDLLQMGFSKQQCGNYFYSVIARLKAADRISVLPNGDLWRKPA